MASHEIFILLVGMNVVLTMTGGFAHPAIEIANQNDEDFALPLRLFGYNHQDAAPQTGAPADKSTNCYHFYVTRNMSSLLSDATKMLRQVHNKREREWVLTFIYRIKSLAEHLRSHPDSQNYEGCLGVEDDPNRMILSESLRIPQPELYFEDEIQLNQNQKRSMGDNEPSKSSTAEVSDNQNQNNQFSDKDLLESKEQSSSQQMESENYNSVAESTSESVTLKKDLGEQVQSDSSPTVAMSTNSQQEQISQQDMSSSPEDAETEWMTGKGSDSANSESPTKSDCPPRKICKKVENNAQSQETDGTREEDELERQLHARRQSIDEELKHEQFLKERIHKALMEELAPEIKKLRTVGGTADDLLKLWKQSEIDVAKDEEKKRLENDFDYEEEGAAAGDLNSDKSQASYRTIAPSSDQVENYKKPTDEMPYVHNDVLVQQLYDAGREDEPLYRSTRALDPQDEYLIISTHIPY